MQPIREADEASEAVLSARGAERRSLPNLTPEAFAHPQDGQAIGVLRRLKGFDRVVGKVIEWRLERPAYVELTAGSVCVSQRQLPRIHALLAEACKILDMEEPELYIMGGGINALTSGHNHPYIVLYSALVDVMDDHELQAVIGHELGHIKCNHVLYKEMVRWMTELGVLAAGAKVSRRSATAAAAFKLALRQFSLALVTWDQKSELSADRAAMLVVQDEAACIRMFLKLAGAPARLTAELSVEAFLEQARRLQDMTADSVIAEKWRRQMAEGSSHPLLVERARQLDQWIHGGDYERVLSSSRATVPWPTSGEVSVGRRLEIGG